MKRRTASERATEYEKKAKAIRDKENVQKQIREHKDALKKLRGKK